MVEPRLTGPALSAFVFVDMQYPPSLFNVLLNRSPESFPETEEGIQFAQAIDFYFLRDDLVDANIVPEVGDIILYQEAYYGVDGVVTNQYWSGKNPDYPNNNSDGTPNPLNPGLDQFGLFFILLYSIKMPVYYFFLQAHHLLALYLFVFLNHRLKKVENLGYNL